MKNDKEKWQAKIIIDPKNNDSTKSHKRQNNEVADCLSRNVSLVQLDSFDFQGTTKEENIKKVYFPLLN